MTRLMRVHYDPVGTPLMEHAASPPGHTPPRCLEPSRDGWSEAGRMKGRKEKVKEGGILSNRVNEEEEEEEEKEKDAMRRTSVVVLE